MSDTPKSLDAAGPGRAGDPAAAVLAAGDALRRASRVAWCKQADAEHADPRWRALDERADWLTTEEPLQISIDGDAILTTMRTPGHDRELALGLLLSEGIIASRSDVNSLAYCGRADEVGYGNALDVKLVAGALSEDALLRRRRGTLTTASCGVCGRASIDDLVARCSTLNDDFSMTATTIAELSGRLRNNQLVFTRTGGSHAAGLTDGSVDYRWVFEDVGRHNAVDKCVGRALLDGQLPLRRHALVVSGRASFEIVQKAVVARIPVVIGVSAPSSMAVDLAQRCNLTLVAFATPERFNLYTAPQRVREA